MLIKKTALTVTALTGLAVLMPAATQAANPYMKPDQAEVTLTGEIEAIYADNFTLNYGDGLITVEMDDWDFYNDTAPLVVGETVTVNGEIDHDFYEAKTVEAGRVYSYETSTYYYANDADEEDADYWVYSYPVVAPEGTWLALSGIVQEIDGSEFVLDTGLDEMRIETAYLNSDPLDDEGVQQIDSGDRVYVSGEVDNSVFDDKEIEASSVITLTKDATKTTN